MESNIDFSLNMAEINAQIEEESLMPAELVTSAYKILTYTDDEGGTSSRNVWQLEWSRLDKDLGDFYYRSSHNLPDPNSDKPVTQRGRMTYAVQVTCFSKLGIEGSRPEDFLGLKHWIREEIVGSGRFQKTWYRSEAIYVEGQTYEEAKGINAKATNMNPPSEAVSSNSSPTEPVSLDGDSPYEKFLDIVNGLTHRQAIAALEKDDALKSNEEIMTGVKSGSIFEEMIDQGLLEENDGKYVKVS